MVFVNVIRLDSGTVIAVLTNLAPRFGPKWLVLLALGALDSKVLPHLKGA